MPSLFKKKVGFGKDCANCKKEYAALEATTHDEAYEAFRKFFSPRKNARDGLESSCFRCRAMAEMRIKFGIDVETIINQQDGLCAICGIDIEFNTGINSASACVDHDHSTGETRGILCRSCNLGLGHFKDNIYLLL